MKLSLAAITLLSPLALSQARLITSTIFYGECWTDADGGTITTSLPGATSTYSDPATTTQTLVDWYYPDLQGRQHRDDLTVVETDQCTETDTAYVTSTVRETVATLTSTVTQYASTATVTVTSTCLDWGC